MKNGTLFIQTKSVWKKDGQKELSCDSAASAPNLATRAQCHPIERVSK
jgi:hypothetical protein